MRYDRESCRQYLLSFIVFLFTDHDVKEDTHPNINKLEGTLPKTKGYYCSRQESTTSVVKMSLTYT